ncbi:MAG: hypothetical protein K2W96_09615, partial [Gemmataceae bacterium]|nr:hypothetical protein [Gemmataceae bacterium]
VQFEGAVFVGKEEGKPYRLGYGHHTAVVARVRGTRLAILHQNDGGDKRVRMTFLELSGLAKGEVAFFRPLRHWSDD